jgi:RNA polymerase sigma factor (sigma-70 family)
MTFATFRCDPRIDVEEVVNRALEKAMLRFDQGRPVKFRTFLRRILICELANAWRQRRKDLTMCVPWEDHIDAIDEAQSRRWALRETRELLDTVLARLPDEDRRLLYWKYEEGCTFEEISERL